MDSTHRDRKLKCPNDGTSMHEIITTGRHGAELVLDQCGCCGGIWFDQYELFRVGEAQARQAERVDEMALRCPVGRSEEPFCPVCAVPLEVFRDPNIPENIQLLSCSKCNGFWVNHGELIHYSEFRISRGHKAPDPKLAEAYEQMLKAESKKDFYEGMSEFGHNVGGARDFLTGLPLDGSSAQVARIDQAQDAFFTMLGVAARLMLWWL